MSSGPVNENFLRAVIGSRLAFAVVLESGFLQNNDEVRSRICCRAWRAAYYRYLRDFERLVLEQLQSPDQGQRQVALALLTLLARRSNLNQGRP